MPATALNCVANARARRAERLAVAQALRDAALDWAALDACPAWLIRSEAQRELLCARAGAWWLGAALRGCIDGQRLARVRALLGQAWLDVLRDTPVMARAEALGQVPSPLLPAADDVPQHLVACGRALLAWSLPETARAPLLQHLGWTLDDGHQAVFAAHPQWARQALHMALQDDAVSALPSVDEALDAPEPAADATVADALIESDAPEH